MIELGEDSGKSSANGLVKAFGDRIPLKNVEKESVIANFAFEKIVLTLAWRMDWQEAKLAAEKSLGSILQKFKYTIMIAILEKILTNINCMLGTLL